MRWPRVRIWWLMVRVAVIALGCAVIPPWWRCHHEMLRRSEEFRETALNFEAIAYLWDRAQDPNGVAKANRKEARKLRGAATFPWRNVEPNWDVFWPPLPSE